MTNSLWVELHIEMPRHPKTTALARELKISRREAIGLLADLWAWAIHCADAAGLLPGVTDEDMAIVLDWPRKRAAALTGALKSAGWLEGDSGGYLLHDWPDYTGRLYERRRDAQRKREARRRLKAGQGAGGRSAGEIWGTAPGAGSCFSGAGPCLPPGGLGEKSLADSSLGAEMSGGNPLLCADASGENPGVSAPNPRAGYNPTEHNQTGGSPEDCPGDILPPAAEEVQAYVAQLGGRVDGARFVDYYSTLGWRIKGQPIWDWRALVRLWEKRERPKTESTFDLADLERLNVFDIVEPGEEQGI